MFSQVFVCPQGGGWDGLCPGGSLSEEVSVRETLRMIRILLEYILVKILFYTASFLVIGLALGIIIK